MGLERLSVAIVNFNTRADLLACLAAVRADAPGAEVVVYDNGSVDGSVAAVRALAPGVRVLEGHANRGFAAAVNACLADTRGEYVLVLNPDAILRPGASAALVEHLDDNPRVAIAGPRILDPDGSLQASRRSFPGHATALCHRWALLTRLWPGNPLSRRYLRTDLEAGAAAAVDWVSGAAILLRRRALEAIGPLDEGYFLYVEDVDLCLRARRAGWEVAYVPAAIAVHRIGAASRLVPRLALVERHRSMWRYYAKHMRRSPWLDAATLLALGARLLWLVVALSLGGPAFQPRPGCVNIPPP